MNDDEQHGPAKRFRAPIVAVLLVVAGVLAVAFALHAQQHAPQPPASAAVVEAQPAQPSTAGSSPASGHTATTRGLILPASTPTNLRIPSIGVNSNLLRLGLNADHTAQVPPQTAKAKAGWYRYSPSPGQLGPAIILGHVDSAKYGPGVFFKLGALKPGATVSITRADHMVAVFRVDRVVSYSKNNFPTFDVYGNTNHAALRLITCGGKFNFSKHSYESNIVTYASLVSTHQA